MEQRRFALVVFTVSLNSFLINNFIPSSNYGSCGVTAACKTVDLKDRVQLSATALWKLTSSKIFNFRCSATALLSRRYLK